jgi:hypothetical protein
MTMKKGFISPLFFEENFVCIVFLIDRTLLLCHCIFSWPAGFLMKNLILSWGFPCDKFVCLFVSFFLSFCAEGILWHLQKKILTVYQTHHTWVHPLHHTICLLFSEFPMNQPCQGSPGGFRSSCSSHPLCSPRYLGYASSFGVPGQVKWSQVLRQSSETLDGSLPSQFLPPPQKN